jgi:glycopeptide antibiotics resistance protein
LEHKKLLRVIIKYNKPGICWALLIWLLCTISTPSLDIPDLFDLFAPDKIVHFFFYAVLVFLFLHGFEKINETHPIKRNHLAIVIACIAYGGLIELYQGYFLSNRVADWTDFLANAIGTLIGWAIYKNYSKRKRST